MRTATFTVPLTWAPGTNLVIFSHAALVGVVAGVPGETAWAGRNSLAISRWNFYITYELPPVQEDPTERISGTAFFDINGNGVQDRDEPGIPGVDMTLLRNDLTVDTTVTDANGDYLFDCLYPVEYVVQSGLPEGMVRTTPESLTETASASDVDFGYNLDDDWFVGKYANGYTIGFWKTNLDKAIAGETRGVQVSRATLESYVAMLSTFALEPLNPKTLQEASAILSSTGSDPVALLAKQLMASEFNYANGAYIGGSKTLTYLFLYRGEFLLKYAAYYDASVLLEAKDWYDAYNNTHGGMLTFPVL